MLRSLLLVGCGWGALPAAAAAPQGADTRREPALAFRGARVITVSGRTYRRGVVVVRGRRILAVREDVSLPEDARTVDVRGKVLMPGLVLVTTRTGTGSSTTCGRAAS